VPARTQDEPVASALLELAAAIKESSIAISAAKGQPPPPDRD